MAAKPALSDTELFAQRGFGLRIGFGDRPALIIIDMANAFTDQTAMLGSNLDDQIAATVPILEAAHARNIPVYFSTDPARDARWAVDEIAVRQVALVPKA